MNKKVMALAVAGALAAPAAALAQVQIGGGITLLYFQHDPDNSTSGQSSDVMQSSESEIRINGSEKLGGGLEVWFQCASSIDGIIGGNTATTAGWCTRNSAIGFRGDFGNVFFGNWDTPLKLIQNRVRGWFSGTNALVGGGYTLLAGSSASGVGNGTGGSANASFYRRQANTVNYASPNWGGFSLAAAFSAANETASLPESNPLNPRLMGLNGVFATGPFWVGVGYEKHDDYNPGSQAAYTGGSDDNITIGVGFTFARVLNLRATYSKSNYETAAGGESEVTGFGAYVDWNISGPHALHFAFITVDDVEGSGGAVNGYRAPGAATGADVFTVAYGYNFSKRTEVYVAYNEMKNDSNANFSQGVVAASLGGKQTSIGIGLKHSF